MRYQQNGHTADQSEARHYDGKRQFDEQPYCCGQQCAGYMVADPKQHEQYRQCYDYFYHRYFSIYSPLLGGLYRQLLAIGLNDNIAILVCAVHLRTICFTVQQIQCFPMRVAIHIR